MGASGRTVGQVMVPAAAAQIFLIADRGSYAVIGAVIGSIVTGPWLFHPLRIGNLHAGSVSGIIILVAIVFVANFCLNLLEGRVIRWRKGEVRRSSCDSMARRLAYVRWHKICWI